MGTHAGKQLDREYNPHQYSGICLTLYRLGRDGKPCPADDKTPGSIRRKIWQCGRDDFLAERRQHNELGQLCGTNPHKYTGLHLTHYNIGRSGHPYPPSHVPKSSRQTPEYKAWKQGHDEWASQANRAKHIGLKPPHCFDPDSDTDYYVESIADWLVDHSERFIYVANVIQQAKDRRFNNWELALIVRFFNLGVKLTRNQMVKDFADRHGFRVTPKEKPSRG